MASDFILLGQSGTRVVFSTRDQIFSLDVTEEMCQLHLADDSNGTLSWPAPDALEGDQQRKLIEVHHPAHTKIFSFNS